MPKILLVDDEPYVTATVRARLKRSGHEVEVANDGCQGLAVALAFGPNLVVSDLQMPVMTGLEMAIALRANQATSATPVILLTGRSHLVPPEELAHTRIVQLLSKPFSTRDLVEQIDRVLAIPVGAGVAA